MSLAGTCGVVLAVWTLWTFASGCGSCRNKPAPASADAGASVQEPAAVQEPRQPTASPSTRTVGQRPPARLQALPPSYFGLDRSTHTRIRAQTARMGHIERDAPDPADMGGFAVAALDTSGREPDADRWNSELDDLYKALLDGKVFTVAKPVMVIWNADAGRGAVSWSIGVPVAEETEVKPPLVRQRMPAMKVHVIRGEAREILGRFGGRKEENPTVWTFVGNAMRAARSTLGHPTVLMFRFPDWELADLDDHSEMELVLGEPVAAASPPAASDSGPGQGPPPAVP